MKRLATMIVVAGLGALAIPSAPQAQAGSHPVTAARPPTVQQALTALDKLAQYGYTVSTPRAADRAIRHWQKVNGLTIDGIVGPETLASLHLVPLPPAVAGSTAEAPAPRGTVSEPAGDVEQIIRDVWPDELEDHALAIAHRESRLQPTARNACCYGLFQIHWQAHRSWMGLSGPEQLLDARTNADIAYALYQRAGGWGPWSL